MPPLSFALSARRRTVRVIKTPEEFYRPFPDRYKKVDKKNKGKK